jgi:hypothetical protein
MTTVRRIGAAVLTLAALAVWFLMAPETPEAPAVQTREGVADRSVDIAEALLNYEANEARTQGAPQQSVVNGWVAKDLLTIIAEQQNEALTRDDVPAPAPPVTPNDDRIPALVGLLVVGMALALGTTTKPNVRDESAPTETTPSDYTSPVPVGA